jgi:hypothetical protein
MGFGVWLLFREAGLRFRNSLTLKLKVSKAKPKFEFRGWGLGFGLCLGRRV